MKRPKVTSSCSLEDERRFLFCTRHSHLWKQCVVSNQAIMIAPLPPVEAVCDEQSSNHGEQSLISNVSYVSRATGNLKVVQSLYPSGAVMHSRSTSERQRAVQSPFCVKPDPHAHMHMHMHMHMRMRMHTHQGRQSSESSFVNMARLATTAGPLRNENGPTVRTCCRWIRHVEEIEWDLGLAVQVALVPGP